MAEVKRILVADGDQELVKTLGGYLSRQGYEVKVATSASEAVELAGAGEGFDLVITALNLPQGGGMEVLRAVKRQDARIPVAVLSSEGSVETAVAAMKEGADEYISKGVVPVEVIQESLAGMLSPRAAAAAAAAAGPKDRSIVTADPRLEKLLEMARAVADSRATVLISGESGTGKELFARFLHENSARAGGPFVAVNCASLPEGLLESELFGHEKGAFTGAIARKQGRFELAHGGTILLDEVSEMAVNLQAKLLRVLQESEIDRVGGKRPVPVDVRVVATTNRDLKEHIAAGSFREDLYYRLNVIPLKVPALRERGGDVLLLAEHFLARYARENNRPGLKLSPEAKRVLAAQPWPGNVRELQNTMERAVLLAAGNEITPEALLFDDQAAPAETPAAPGLDLSGPPPTLRELERSAISQALEHTEGNRTHAAKLLGISVRTLRNKLNEYKAAQEG
jgi:two-component system response regulator FlrC